MIVPSSNWPTRRLAKALSLLEKVHMIRPVTVNSDAVLPPRGMKHLELAEFLVIRARSSMPADSTGLGSKFETSTGV